MSDFTIPSDQIGYCRGFLICKDSGGNNVALPSGGALSVAPAGIVTAAYDPVQNLLTVTPITGQTGTVTITYADPGTVPASISATVAIVASPPSLAINSGGWYLG